MTSEQNFDFVAIGDLVMDAFIRLRDAEVHDSVNHETRQLCLRFGDKIPYESVTIVPAVGNSPNAAVAAARLGLRSALISNLGADRNGDECLATLKKEGVGTDWVARHADHATNYHYVLWFQDDRTILIKHQEYPYALPDIGAPKWIYLSSLGENSLPFHQTIAEYLAAQPEVKLAFQPGTFQIKLGVAQLAEIYRHSEVFFCNVEEAKRILGTEESEIKVLLQKIAELGPKIVVITDGPRGAYAWQNGSGWFMPPYPDPKPPLERTGAGDSFASTFTSALALGKSVPEALAWGPINSAFVVQQIGAQAGLLPRVELEKHLAAAPTEYRAQTL
jgi:ribokinase